MFANMSTLLFFLKALKTSTDASHVLSSYHSRIHNVSRNIPAALSCSACFWLLIVHKTI